MRVKVKQGESVCYQGIWYHQAAEIEVDSIGDMQGKVEVLGAPKQPKTKKEEG